MFKSLSLFALFLASASSVVGQATEENKYLDIKTVCKQTPKLGLFGQLLEQRPDIYAVYANLKDKTFFLPTDDALKEYYAATGNIFRRATTDVGKASYQLVNSQTSVNQLTQQGRTTLSSGDGTNKMVSNPVPQTVRRKRQLQLGNDTVTTTGVTLSTGLGTKSEILFGDIHCTQGLIQVVDTLFSVPETSSETLKYMNLTKFNDGVSAAGLASTYDSAPNITIFAPQDSAFKNWTMNAEAVQLHVVENEALYTPDLEDGSILESSSGEKLYVTVTDGDFYINCVKITIPDAIISNGVVHVTEEIIKPLSAPPSCWSGAVVEPVKFTGSAPMNQAGNMLAVVGAIIALFAFAV